MLRTKRLARERVLPKSVLATAIAGAVGLLAACTGPSQNVKAAAFGRHSNPGSISNSGSEARRADAIKAIRLAYGLNTMAFELSYGKHAVWESGVESQKVVPSSRAELIFQIVEAALGRGSADRSGELSDLLPEESSYAGVSRDELINLVATGGLEQTLRDGIGTDQSLAVLDMITSICDHQWHRGRRLWEETPDQFSLSQWQALYDRMKGYRDQLISMQDAERETEKHKPKSS